MKKQSEYEVLKNSQFRGAEDFSQNDANEPIKLNRSQNLKNEDILNSRFVESRIKNKHSSSNHIPRTHFHSE
jgi:hypothetical protein